MPELLDFSAQSEPLDFSSQSEPLDFSGQSEPIGEQVSPQEMAQIEAGQGGVPAVEPPLPQQARRLAMEAEMRKLRQGARFANAFYGIADASEQIDAQLTNPLSAVVNAPADLIGRPDLRPQPLVSPEQGQKVVEFFDPLGKASVGSARSGVKEAGGELISGMTSPEAFITMGAGSEVAVPAFALQAAAQIPAATAALANAKTPQEEGKAATQLAVAIAAAGGGAWATKDKVQAKGMTVEEAAANRAAVNLAAPGTLRPQEVQAFTPPQAEAPSMVQTAAKWEQLIPKEFFPQMEASVAEAAQRIVLAKERAAELSEAGKLPTGGTEFVSVGEKAGFDLTAEEKLTRGTQQTGREIEKLPIITEATPLHTISELVKNALQKRDWVQAVSILGQTKASTGVRVVNDLLGVGREKVPLSAAEKTIFEAIWDEAVKRSLERTDNAESLSENETPNGERVRDETRPGNSGQNMEQETQHRTEGAGAEAQGQAPNLGVAEAVSLAQFHDPISMGSLLGAFQQAHKAGYVGPDAQQAAWGIYQGLKESGSGINNFHEWLTKTKRIEELLRQEASAGPKALPVGGAAKPGPITRSGPPPAKVDEGALETGKSQSPNMTGLGATVPLAGEGEPQPQAAVAPVQPGPPESRIGIVPFSSPAASGIFRSLLQGLQTGTGQIGTALRIAAGDTLPRMTKAARRAAEALASFASSNDASPMLADLFTHRVLADSGLSKREYGGYLTEETLRANKAKFLQEAAQAAARGDAKAWQEHLDEAANVKTFIGAHNFPFRTEAQFRAYGARPDVQAVITRNRALHFNEIEPMHQEASRLAPGTIQQSAVSPNLGFHVSLKGVKAGSSRTAVVAGQTPLGNLRATLRKFNPLTKRRTGAADAYEIDFGELMRHKFQTELPISLHNRTINEMISGGVAIAGKFDKPPEIGGQPSVPVPLSHGYRFVNEGETTFFKPGENLYVRADLVKEFRNALNTDMALQLPAPFQKAMNLLNSSALMGFADATSHGATLFGQFIQAQTPLLTKLGAPLDMLRRAALDATDAVTRAGERNLEQLSRITLIGAGRAKFPTYRYNPLSVPTHIVHWLDKTYRLMMDDAFTEMASKGRFEDTPTNRREFINQGLQYNKRLQGLVIRKARELGFSPFVTAARAANMQGLRMSTLAGPVPRNATARAMLLTNSVATIVGAFALRAALNYALTKNAGGRAGTDIDQVDLGINDDKGRPIRLGLLSWLGVGRTMRTTGAAAYINAKRNHLPGEVPGEQAMQQAANQQLGQWLGPVPRLAIMAGTGHTPMFGGRRESPASGPDLNQWLSFKDRPWYNPRGNIPHAVAEANPLLGAYYETHELGRDPKDVLMRQLSKWGPQYGQTDVRQQSLPERVHGARLEDWIDDVVTRSRRYAPGDPMTYALQEADKEKLEGADRKRAIDQFRKRLRGQ